MKFAAVCVFILMFFMSSCANKPKPNKTDSTEGKKTKKRAKEKLDNILAELQDTYKELYAEINKNAAAKPKPLPIVIPTDKNARNQRVANREKYTFLKKHFLKNIKDKKLAEYVDEALRIKSRQSNARNPENLLKEGSELAEKRKSNLFFAIWHGFLLNKCKKFKEAEAVFQEALPVLKKDKKLSHIQKIYFHYFLINSWKGQNKDFFPIDINNETLNALKNGEFSKSENSIAYNLVYYGSSPGSLVYLEKRLKKNKKISPWLLKMIRGANEINLAWKARGGGWSSTVTKEGWKGFKAHMSKANKELREAWTLSPERPEAASRMITVAMTGYANKGESEELWFNRAVAAQMDYSPAYHSLMWALRPRWSGSRKRMLEFGEKCLKTKRFDTDIPLVYLRALCDIAGEMSDFFWRAPFRAPGVHEKLLKLLDGLKNCPQRKNEIKKIKALRCICELFCGNYLKAKELFKDVGSDADLDYLLSSRSYFERRKKKQLETEINLFTGKHSKELIKAEMLFFECPEDSLEIFKTTMSLVENEKNLHSYLLERIGFMMLEVSSENVCHDWTALHMAAIKNNLKVAKYLIENGANIRIENQDKRTPLHYAAKSSDLPMTRLLIENGANINAKDAANKTPLYLAIYAKKADVTKYLLEKGADLNAITNSGKSPLFCAIMSKMPEIAKLLIKKGVDVNPSSKNGRTPLFAAVSKKMPEMVKLLIEKGAHVNTKTDDNRTPVFQAIRKKDSKILKILINSGANINIANARKWTPLHYAAKNAAPSLIRILVENGADLNAKTIQGRTPLIYALNRPEAANLLIDSGADLNTENSYGWTPLFFAIEMKILETAKKLIEKGADLNHKSKNGLTPLLCSILKNAPKATELLMEKGANLNVTDNKGWTPILYASRYAKIPLVKQLIGKGGNVNAVNKSKWSPLHMALYSKKPEIAKFLIENGADVNAINKEKWTPLHYALRYNMGDAAKLLVKKGAELDKPNLSNWRPLYISIFNCKPETTKMLVQNGANVNAKMKGSKWTALHFAIFKNKVETAKFFLENGAEINAPDADIWTPLYRCALMNKIEIAKLLLENGAEINIKSNKGKTALDVAKSDEMKELLKKHGAKPGKELN